MYGDLCFLTHGNMICGVHKAGGMARVGKLAEPVALSLPGVNPLSFTGRTTGGMVDISPEAMDDDMLRRRLIGLALTHVQNLPPK